MADLREVVTSLGHTDVRTVLQSGNVVFTAGRAVDADAAAALEQALLAATGVQASVPPRAGRRPCGHRGREPVADITTDASRGFVTFLSRPLDRGWCQVPDEDVSAPEVLVVAERAIYQWCPGRRARHEGAASVVEAAGPGRSPRANWRTVQRLVELCDRRVTTGCRFQPHGDRRAEALAHRRRCCRAGAARQGPLKKMTSSNTCAPGRSATARAASLTRAAARPSSAAAPRPAARSTRSGSPGPASGSSRCGTPSPPSPGGSGPGPPAGPGWRRRPACRPRRAARGRRCRR